MENQINETSLGWWEWFMFKTNEFGSTAMNVCDSLGDSLSSFFGITTPKYQFEIDHFNMMKQLEAENSDAEMGAMNVQPTKPLDAKLEKSASSTSPSV
ncbi:protein FAM177A1-like isoform X2 [Planococcus citri]|uniref:protein FAM177A1-like isoform X2 n=1 Tax=Planococcus citri TaxID=170843 RepID=UPI0031F85967